MTVDDVKSRVEEIERKGDVGMQHAAEDQLHSDVLQAIADGAPNGAELAAEALKTRDLDFSRWYA